MENEVLRYFGVATGRVQGVGFRMFVREHAMDMGITGWIRNMEDGSVHMEIQGPQSKIDALEKLIRDGNYFIKVQSFGLEKRDVVADEKGFEIRY